jgi:hypothetical protein
MSCDTARRRKTIRAPHRPTVDLFDCVNGSLATNMFVIYLLVVVVVKPSSCFSFCMLTSYNTYYVGRYWATRSLRFQRIDATVISERTSACTMFPNVL